MCHLQLEGYECIKQGKTFSNKGGLVMYLSKTFNYKVMFSLNQFDNWEGQFIKVTGGGLSKDIIIGNIYMPSRDLNENYKQFLFEFTPIISSFDRTNSDVIIPGNFNINLLKINEKEVFAEFFNTLISYSFYPKKTFTNSFIYNENIIADKTAIANTFNLYFTNIGPNLANQIQNSTNKTFRYYLNGNHDNVFNFQLINEETISKTIDEMHTKVSCGCDGISSRLLKLIKHVLTKSLTLITNQILTTGIFPDKLETAKVIPIYKKGTKPYSATTGQYQSYLQFQK